MYPGQYTLEDRQVQNQERAEAADETVKDKKREVRKWKGDLEQLTTLGGAPEEVQAFRP